MPIIEMSGPEAIATRKTNSLATWGQRNAPNRVEPVTKPGFNVPFKMEPGEKIFTVGSCFARHVETALLQRGFNLPMRALFDQPEFRAVIPGIVNNFGTPSIYNEFAWALGDREFNPSDHIIEVQKDKFVDMHVISSMRPTDYKTVLKRRNAITQAYKSFQECRVIIITLGLVEVWYDTKTSYYLNSAPRPAMHRAEPDRYKLHVLSFDEIYSYLEKSIELIRKHGRDDVKIILTVSPVPLAVTHRDEDVIVANSYSKSALRTAADTIIAKYDFVSYYPSFESVSLSDRKYAWRDDFNHVTDEIVALNINRMVDAFVGTDWTIGNHRDAIEQGGMMMAVERAEKVRLGSYDAAKEFFDEFQDFSKTSASFAQQHIEFLLGIKEFEEAVKVVDHAPKDAGYAITMLKAKALIQLGRTEDAFSLISELAENSQRNLALWKLYFEAAKATKEPAKVIEVAGRWITAFPRNAGRTNALTGRWFYDQGNYDKALELLDLGIRISPDDALIRIYRTEALLAKQDYKAADKEFERIKPQLKNEFILYERLKGVMGK